MNFSRCEGIDCSDNRPIIVVAQGYNFHYDGKDPGLARDELLKELNH